MVKLSIDGGTAVCGVRPAVHVRYRIDVRILARHQSAAIILKLGYPSPFAAPRSEGHGRSISDESDVELASQHRLHLRRTGDEGNNVAFEAVLPAAIGLLHTDRDVGPRAPVRRVAEDRKGEGE